MDSRLCIQMHKKRHAQRRAQATRALRELAWELGITPKLLKAALISQPEMARNVAATRGSLLPALR